MKKLISLLFAFVLTVPMWAWYAYADYGYNSNNTMGFIYVGSTTSPAAGNSSWKNAKTSKSMSGSNKTVYFGAFPRLGYEFVGWYKGSASSSANVGSGYTNNPYSASLSSETTYYARFQAISYTASQTKNYTISGKSCTMNAYDMKTNDGIYWGDRAIGATDLRGVGLYFRYGDLTPVTSTSTSDIYTQYSADSHKYTTSGNLPADQDIATRTLGEGWRMPTKTEYTTLISKVDFIKDERDGGYAGAKAKTAVNNKNNIIYFYYGGYYKSSTKDDGGSTYSYMRCCYWSSTNCTTYTSANTYYFKMAATSSHPWTSSIGANDNYGTYYALQVKPVYDTRTNYTLTIKGGVNGSSTLKTNTGKWGATFSYIAPDIDGYTFTGWSDGNTDQERTFYTCDMVITAQYEVSASNADYTVTLDNQDATTAGASSVTATYDQAMPSIASNLPAKTGYTFNGYYSGTNSNGTKYYNADGTSAHSYDINDDATLYAYWTPNTNTAYTVKHYKQNIDCSTYPASPFETDNLTGTTATNVTPSVKNYEGFTVPATQTVSILADGSRVVEYYYTRNKYTVTIESNNTSYGTVDVASVANVPYGTTITTSTNTIDVNGTTVTATPATVTGYTCTFSNWTNGTAIVTGVLTVTANFSQTENNYSVTFRKSADDQNPAVKSDYHYGDEITNCPSDLSAQKIGFVFTGWYLDGAVPEVRYTSGMTVTGNMIFTARYSTALSITIPAYENHGKVLVHTIDRTYTVTSDGNEDEEKIIYVASGSRITIEPVADAYFHFAGWTPNPGEYLDGNFIEIDNVQSNITYTPTWEQNVTLSLVDTENEAYYTALYSNATYAGNMLTVTMTGRRLTAGSWMTFCAPFEFDIPAGHPMDGAVYRFINGTMTGTNTEGYISLDFVRTYKIEANVPYLVVAKTTTDTDLEFDGVTIEDAPEQKPVVASSGDVQFVSQPWKDALVNEALELADFYIASGNTLRYAKVGNPGTTIRAFRAYFHRLRDLNATPAPRRIVISLDGVETTKEIGVDGEIEDTTRKYMENGILYIERNGVRYDAQGQRAE